MADTQGATGLAITAGSGDASSIVPLSPGSGSAGPSRQRLDAAMAGLDCSRLQIVELPHEGGLELRGHVPTEELASDIVAASQRLAGRQIRVTGNLMVLPPPLCRVLDSLESIGLPQSADQWNDPLAVGLPASANMPRANDGERAVFGFVAPDYDAHIYVDYFDGGGNVVHLLPSDVGGANRVPANTEFHIGNSEQGSQLFYSWPLGLDIAVAIASTEPLYGGSRPIVEDARAYLDWLQGRVLAQRASHPDFRGEWVFMLMRVESG